MHSPEAQHIIFAGWRCQYGPRNSSLPTLAQAQVAAGLAAGLTQKEIAKLRNVSPSSVRTTAEGLYWRLGVYRAAAAVAEAVRLELIAKLIVLMLISGINTDAEALRHRQPTRTRQQVSASRTLARRDTGSVFA